MRTIRRLAVAAVIAASVAAATPAWADDTGALLTKRLDNPRLGSDFAMVVVDAASGEVVSEHRSDNPQLPASTMKIITAVSTLANLEPSRTFTTKALRGAVDGERTEVILVGGGDPLLSRSDLETLAKRTAAALTAGADAPGSAGKPKAIVRADRLLFADAGRAPGWPADYIPSVAADVESLALLGDYSREPSANAARAFAGYLKANGIKATVGDDVTSAPPPDATELAQVSTHTVSDAIKRMLSVSENNVAEVLHRHVALARGQQADWAGAQAATEATLRDLGLDPSDQRLYDGSGLSRKDRVTPRFLSDVIRTARTVRPEKFALIFEDDALPVAGRTGTLDDAYGRFVTKHARCAQGMAHAKTGSLFDTIALAGLTKTTDGSERIFTMLVNHAPTQYSALAIRQALDGLVATAAGCWR